MERDKRTFFFPATFINGTFWCFQTAAVCVTYLSILSKLDAGDAAQICPFKEHISYIYSATY